MSVIHLEPVSNYEKCLRDGGEHVFEITLDEMPALEAMVPPGETKAILFEDVAAGLPDGIWSAIARMLSEEGTTFCYQCTRPGIYRVICKVPPPGPD
jgi:hypothetical protein